MIKNTIIGSLVVTIVLLVGALVSSGVIFGAVPGSFHTNLEQFAAGLNIGGGTNISKYVCYTATFNPDSVSSSTAASSKAILTPSATKGDIIVGSFDSVTSTNLWYSYSTVTAGSGTTGASSTLYIRGVDGAAVDLTTSTAKICVLN